MSNAGDGRCPNCGVTRPSSQFHPVRLVPGAGGMSTWLRCPACGFRGGKQKFGVLPQSGGVIPSRNRPKSNKPARPTARTAEGSRKAPEAKPSVTERLQAELSRVQARVSEVAAEIEAEGATNDEEYLIRLGEIHRKLQSTSFDLRVKIALIDDSPPAR